MTHLLFEKNPEVNFCLFDLQGYEPEMSLIEEAQRLSKEVMFAG